MSKDEKTGFDWDGFKKIDEKYWGLSWHNEDGDDYLIRDALNDLHERVRALEAVRICGSCMGRGYVQVTTEGVVEGGGAFAGYITCDACNGTGRAG
jgi:hypothetical protein